MAGEAEEAISALHGNNVVEHRLHVCWHLVVTQILELFNTCIMFSAPAAAAVGIWLCAVQCVIKINSEYKIVKIKIAYDRC